MILRMMIKRWWCDDDDDVDHVDDADYDVDE